MYSTQGGASAVTTPTTPSTPTSTTSAATAAGPAILAAPAAPAACCAPLAAEVLSESAAAATASLFKALADPHRVRIVNLLATSAKPLCVCEFTGPLGLAQPTVSHHLKKLVTAGLLDRQQRGTWAYYSLNRDALSRLAAVADLQGGTP
jgi:ArsR family transcriptional regulator, arsenate/arsenite/antimonite-responsive transcriptional repressor